MRLVRTVVGRPRCTRLMSGSEICSTAEAAVATLATVNEPATPMIAEIGPAIDDAQRVEGQ